MKPLAIYLAAIVLVCLKLQGQHTGADPNQALLQVKRVYVGQLTGGPQADALRDLLIASLTADKMFVITENEERADAVLKGAADDHTFEDTFDTSGGVSGRTNGSLSGGSVSTSSGYAKVGGSIASLGNSMGDNESHHIKERKHEAYAAVRLCTKDGDVIWATTQESLGAKFRGASADVAAKVARQLALDLERAKRTAEANAVVVNPAH